MGGGGAWLGVGLQSCGGGGGLGKAYAPGQIGRFAMAVAVGAVTDLGVMGLF